MGSPRPRQATLAPITQHRAHICTVLAGRLSEQVILGAASGEDQHYSGDERLQDQIHSAGLTSKQANSLYRQTCRLIRRHRKKIINLAKAVLDHPRGRVGRRTIKQIMKTDAECTAIRNERTRMQDCAGREGRDMTAILTLDEVAARIYKSRRSTREWLRNHPRDAYRPSIVRRRRPHLAFSPKITSSVIIEALPCPSGSSRPRNSKTKNLYIRGTYLGVTVDKSSGTNKRSVAKYLILKRIEERNRARRVSVRKRLRSGSAPHVSKRGPRLPRSWTPQTIRRKSDQAFRRNPAQRD